jgi:ATP-dependent DNA ligase
VKSAILDGELVANDERGMASFQRLQNALKDDTEAALIYLEARRPVRVNRC